MWVAGPIGGPDIDLKAPKRLGLIAGGTGISVMSQILRQAFYDKSTTPISLLYACPDPDSVPFLDILLSKSFTHPSFNLTCAVDATHGKPWDGTALLVLLMCGCWCVSLFCPVLML